MRRLGAYLGLIEDPEHPRKRPSRMRTMITAVVFSVFGVVLLLQTLPAASLGHRLLALVGGSAMFFVAVSTFRDRRRG